MDQITPATKADLVIIKKKIRKREKVTIHLVDFVVPDLYVQFQWNLAKR